MQEERREFERFPYPQEDSQINTRILWASSSDYDPLDVSFIDVSRAGLGIVTHNEFSIGDSIKLRIALADSEEVDLVAVVCNRRTVEVGEEGGDSPERLFRYGLYFEYDAEEDDPHCEVVLNHLEEEVKRLHFQPV